jgi:hypothetical protein
VEVTPGSCTVLIASPDLLPALKQRSSQTASEVLTFGDDEALRALEVITHRKPEVVALERVFAETPRGAALINRIKADPALLHSEIRVVSHDSDDVRVSSGRAADAPLPSTAEATPVPELDEPEAAAPAAAPLDQRGTRRARRFRMAASVGVIIDGNAGMLIDLSTFGAQVVSSSVLKPNQRVRIGLSDDHGSQRFNAAVAWASFEIAPNSGPRYRAGIEFVDADVASVEGFCHRHKTS